MWHRRRTTLSPLIQLKTPEGRAAGRAADPTHRQSPSRRPGPPTQNAASLQEDRTHPQHPYRHPSHTPPNQDGGKRRRGRAPPTPPRPNQQPPTFSKTEIPQTPRRAEEARLPALGAAGLGEAGGACGSGTSTGAHRRRRGGSRRGGNRRQLDGCVRWRLARLAARLAARARPRRSILDGGRGAAGAAGPR